MPRSNPRISPVRVLVVDDHEHYRRLAGDVVAATPGFALAGCVDSGVAALAVIAEDPPDLVLVDVRMPGMDGFALTRCIVDRPDPPVVVLISAECIQNIGGADRVISSGAATFVQKQRLSPAMLRATWGRP
jgi:CheY-like chemotaxis protein